MKDRIIGAIIVVTALIVSLLLGDIVFNITMTIAALFGLKELIDIKYEKEKIDFVKISSGIFLTLFLLNGALYKIEEKFLIILPILGLIIPMIFYNNKNRYNINDAFYFLGIVYFLAFSFGTIIGMRDISIAKCVYIFIISFATDTYAYIGGMLIGKHKLTDISPKKTIEGTIVGTAMGVFMGTMFYHTLVGDISLAKVIIMSFVLTILSEIGDLVFSSIKRYFGKKDYSNLIPGHGGILDRFDSVIFVSLGMALILSLF